MDGARDRLGDRGERMLVLIASRLPVARDSRAARRSSTGWLLTGLHGAAAMTTVASSSLYFAKAGAVRIRIGARDRSVPARRRRAADALADERQFLDAVAVSMITPGPGRDHGRVHRLSRRGAAGRLRGRDRRVSAAYLIVVVIARWFHRAAQNQRLRAAVDGVTAAATGAIAGAVIVLGRRALIDVPTWLMFAATLAIVLWSRRKVPEPLLILASGIVGITIQRLSA